MSKYMSTANLSDKELKEQGNRLYSLRKYDEAVCCYTKAIIKNPDVATYFTNRALCHLKMKSWDATCLDCRRALDMDPNLVKGHFFLGQALFEMDSYDEAIKHLQRAHDLAKEQKLNFGDEIACQLRACRKKRWNVQEEKRISQEIELQSYLNRLIREDTERQVERVKEETSANEDQIQETVGELDRACENNTSELNAMFAKIDDRRRRVGHFDPVTRVKLTQDQLIPNFAMKEVVDAFLQDNEWAMDY
ncbi:E3 ubiquitin-protein ligase CHIP isoform X2 [Bacillus rossius redtenbacheri]|uniref:E3 ubiquitin-protein ligase CHIP isoform X2 n=1 Tax=Bacillus rossius redtenbacheri TaxID=93214 RepID=UPI002FDEB96C